MDYSSDYIQFKSKVLVKICELMQDAASVVFIENTRTSILSLKIFIKRNWKGKFLRVIVAASVAKLGELFVSGALDWGHRVIDWKPGRLHCFELLFIQKHLISIHYYYTLYTNTLTWNSTIPIQSVVFYSTFTFR